MDNNIKRHILPEISESVLNECINRAYRKGIILRDDIFVIPEIASMSSDVCGKIIRDCQSRIPLEDENKINIYSLCTFAGIGSVQIWLVNYESFQNEDLYTMLSNEDGLHHFYKRVCDRADMPFESTRFLEFISHIRYLCSYIDMRLKGAIEQQDSMYNDDQIALVTCEILFKIGIAYQVSQLCFATQVQKMHVPHLQQKQENIFPSLLGKLDQITKNINYKQFDNLNVLLKFLSGLVIRAGYELDAFMSGTRRDFMFQLYVCKEKSSIRWKPCEENIDTVQLWKLKTDNVLPYNDSMYIQGYLPYPFSDQVPDPLNYFTVERSEQGIIHAWMVKNMHYFMPGGGHFVNVSRDYIYDKHSWEKCKENISPSEVKWSESLKKLKNISLSDVLPKITFDGNKAVLEYCYWVFNSGLMKAKEIVTYNNGKIIFSDPSIDNIVKYEPDIRFF